MSARPKIEDRLARLEGQQLDQRMRALGSAHRIAWDRLDDQGRKIARLEAKPRSWWPAGEDLGYYAGAAVLLAFAAVLLAYAAQLVVGIL